MFAVGFVLALSAWFVDKWLELVKYRTHDYIGRTVAACVFIVGASLMTASTAIVMWRYLP